MNTTFPGRRESFNTLLSAVIPYLVSNQTRFNLTTTVITALTAKYGDTTTSGTYIFYYSKWADKTLERTVSITANLTKVETELKDMLTSIYEDIPGSVWTENDRLVLRRKRGQKRTYTRHTAEITANTFLRYKLVGPSKLLVLCCAEQDSMRPSINKAAGANAVQLAICIIAPNNTDSSNEQSGKVKKEAVKSVDECPNREIHMKATVLLTFEAMYSKCDVYIYARQYDVRHPELAGPWSKALIVTIP